MCCCSSPLHRKSGSPLSSDIARIDNRVSFLSQSQCGLILESSSLHHLLASWFNGAKSKSQCGFLRIMLMADIEKMVLPTSQPKKIDPGILEEGRKYLPTNRVEWIRPCIIGLQGPKKNEFANEEDVHLALLLQQPSPLTTTCSNVHNSVGKVMLFRFRDSLNLLPGTLQNLAMSLCPDLGTKGSVDHESVNEKSLEKDKETGTLIFPTGEFIGVYYSEELKYAVGLGYKVVPISGYLFERKEILARMAMDAANRLSAIAAEMGQLQNLIQESRRVLNLFLRSVRTLDPDLKEARIRAARERIEDLEGRQQALRAEQEDLIVRAVTRRGHRGD
ncbi:ribose-phosphate pyrophosphokinase 1-like protein [Tanacetum coccineum]